MNTILETLLREEKLLSSYGVNQIVAMCGDGKLRDNSECSHQLRSFLGQIGSDALHSYAQTCLSSPFDKSGLVLQDIVNELGRRLDFEVRHGLYQGRVNAIGYDGIWKSPYGRSLLIEVKTTDAYRINLRTVAEYRERLIVSGLMDQNSSILIVVGREDTGDLEAQVRGSRYAWDVRIISVDALSKLVQVKEQAQDKTVRNIHDLMVPFEYTKVDNIIELTFAAVSEATEESLLSVSESAPSDASGEESTTAYSPAALDAARARFLSDFNRRYRKTVIRKQGAFYWSSDEHHDVHLICAVSKFHPGPKTYWFGYRQKWNEFLALRLESYLMLGCLNDEVAFVIPGVWMYNKLASFHATEHPGVLYWHLHIRQEKSRWLLVTRKDGVQFEITDFLLSGMAAA